MTQHRHHLQRHCEWFVETCYGAIAKTLVFKNRFGHEMRLGLCLKHTKMYLDPVVRAGILESAEASWAVMRPALSPEELVSSRISKELTAHELECGQCAAERNWVIAEGRAGRIRNDADIQYIGQHAVAHCCPEGVRLRYEVGKAIKGL